MSNPLDAIYAKFEAMDNQDVPLEQYPQAAVNALACAGWAVVPRDLPSDVLGEAARNGTMETGNPKHVWDYMISKTRLYPAPKPDSTATGGDVERRARELLAAEYELMGYKALVAGVREFPFAVLSDGDAAAIRAIIAALSAPRQGEVDERAGWLIDAMPTCRPDTMSHGDAGDLWVWAQDVIGYLRKQVSASTPSSAAERRDDELPGLWSHSDFTGGDPDEQCHRERVAPQPVETEGREPFGWFLMDAAGTGVLLKRPDSQTLSYFQTTEGYSAVPLYTVPKPEHPAIDLEQLVEAAAQAISKHHLSNTGVPFPINACRDDARLAVHAILAIIDGAKAGRAEGNES